MGGVCNSPDYNGETVYKYESKAMYANSPKGYRHGHVGVTWDRPLSS